MLKNFFYLLIAVLLLLGLSIFWFAYEGHRYDKEEKIRIDIENKLKKD